jgi:tetratricopeptide (TPR) repeat protein
VNSSLSESANAALFGVQRERLIGRERELGELSSQLDSVLAGKGQLVLVSGEPGIGKTSLSDAIAAEAVPRGFHVAWGRCWDVLGGPVFWPWIQVLRSLLDEVDTSDPQVSSEINLIRQLIPELNPSGHADVPFAEAQIASPIQKNDPEVLRFQLFDSVLRLLKNVSKSTPWLLIFDDCHVADEPSLRLLAFLAKQTRQMRIMQVIVYRDADIKYRSFAHQIVTDLAREGHRYSLQNLSEEEVLALLEVKAPGIKDVALVKKLFQTTEGNPSFLSEIISLLAVRHPSENPVDWNMGTFEVPEQVGAAIRLRCELVSEATRRILNMAAAIGLEFDVRLLARVMESEVLVVANNLIEAQNLNLVRADLRHANRYKFVHALFAETLYDDLEADTRQEFHQRIASVLKAERGDLSEIANHLLKALPRSDIGEAIEHAKQAAQRATDALAYENAANFYQSALAALEDYGSSSSPEYCELLLHLAESKYRIGDFRAALENFEKVAFVARNLGYFGYFARAVFGLGSLPETPGVVNLKLIRQLEDALKLLGDADDAWRARLLGRLAEALQWSDPENRRSSLAEEAVTLARQVGDPATLVEVLYRMYVAILGPDTADERLSMSTEILQLTRQCRNPRLGLRASYLRIRDLLELGRIGEMDREIQTYTQTSADLQQQHLGYLQSVLAMRAMLDGRFDEAERLALEALKLGQNRNDGVASQAYATQISLVRREQDRFSEMEPIIKAFVVQLPDLVFARCALAFCYSELVRPDDARFHFELLAQDNFSRLQRNFSWLAGMALLAETCIFLNDSRRGEILYQQLLPFAQRQASLDMYVSYGPVVLYLGMLANLLQKFDDAEKHFEAALSATSRAGTRPWHAHARFRYAMMLRNRREPDSQTKWTELFQGALADARSLGMKSLERKLLDAQFSSVEPSEPAGSRGTDRVDIGPHRSSVLYLQMAESGQRPAMLGERGRRDLLHRFHTIAYEQLSLWNGHKISEDSDSLVAVFDDLVKGVCAANAIKDSISSMGMDIRAALHCGVSELSRAEALALASPLREQVLSAAATGEVLVSSTCKDLRSEDRIRLTEKQVVHLKGISDECYVFRAEISRSADTFGRRTGR